MEDWITAERITITSLLASIIVSGARKMWVWGYQLIEAEARAARWEDIAMKALKVGEKVIDKVANGK